MNDDLVGFANALREVLGLDPLPGTTPWSTRTASGIEEQEAPWEPRWRDQLVPRHKTDR